jgi:PAS domain S-box-containing protein
LGNLELRETMSNPVQARTESLLLAEKRMLEAIANSVCLPEVLDDLCRTIDAHAPGVISSVALMDPDGKRLWLGAGPRFPAELKPVFPWPIGPGRGACGTAASLKQRVIISDIRTDPRWPDDCRDFPVSHGLRAAWSEPLVSKDGAVLGTFAMYYGEPRVPDTSDLELIEAAGHIALIAIQMERSQTALRESEERYRLAIQAGRMFAFDWDVATDTIVRSEESTGVFSSTGEPTKLTKRELLARVHPEDRAKFMNSLAECTPESPNTQITYRLLRPDGSVLWLERTGHAFFDEQGKMVRMIGMVADITERKQAEEALSTVNQKLIETQERERSRLARELHDDINQRLVLLAVNLDGFRQGLPASAVELRQRIAEAGKQVADIAKDIQDLSHQLHSPKLEYLGLAAGAAGFCRELSDRHCVEIEFHSENIPKDLPKEVSLCLFRVLQEALQNAIKHSGSRHLQVSLRGGANEIELTVQDWGIGFDPQEAIKGRGLGLTSMQERLKLVGGQLSFGSKPQRGTTIHARVPVHPGVESAAAVG